MRKILAACCLVCVLAGCSSNEADGYTQVNASTAAQMMADEDNEIVLDVRTPEEYAEAHIPGAINVPNETIGDDAIAELPDKAQLIMVDSAVRPYFVRIVSFSRRRSWPIKAIPMWSNSAASTTGPVRRSLHKSQAHTESPRVIFLCGLVSL